MKFDLGMITARNAMEEETIAAIFVRGGDIGSSIAESRGKGIPESRVYYTHLAGQGISACPVAYTGCSAALDVSKMNGVCTGNYFNCKIFNARGGRRKNVA